MPSLERFLYAQAMSSFEHAHAYLHGAAAVCALTSRSITTGDLGELTQRSYNASRPHATALGRVSAPEWDRFVPVGEEQLRTANAAGFSAILPTLRHAALANFGSASSVRKSCARVAKSLFPEAVDATVFQSLVAPSLYDRLEGATATIRAAVVQTLQDDLIGNLFEYDSDRASAIAKVQTMHLAIPGAPQGTWAGRARSFRRPDFSSADGALTMMLKQARAVFLDRAASVVAQEPLSALSPLYAAAQRNAYLYLHHGDAVAAILPGLISPPFADERYDDESLFARLMFVFAHEFAHVTAFDGQWFDPYADELLQGYAESTRVEAVADLTAAAALMRTGLVSADALCAAQSQIWCARVGTFTSSGYGTHPPANERGDLICAFLRRHYGLTS
jgi:hypothetical protein